ncbi:MAG: diaminopimelate decarboxylase, partial [Ancrocorticia sp.]
MTLPLEHLAAPAPDGSFSGIWPITARRVDGELTIGGVTASDLVAQFGSPLYVIDEADMRARAGAWKAAIDESFGELAGGEVYYAGKAFLSVAVARWMGELGLCIDTCSEGELRTALAAGVPGAKIGLHGNNKSRAEIELALEAGVGHVVVDSLAELALVEAVAGERNQTAPIVLRVTTGIHAGGHEYISTAHEDQKFGLSISTGGALRAAEEALAAPHLELVGLHSHIGSQILTLDAFTEAAKAILDLRAQIAATYDVAVPEIDFGGGYAIRYTVLDDVPPSAVTYAAALAGAVTTHVTETGLAAPKVSIEPGRSIAGPAGITIYTVGTIKSVELDDGSRRYVSVDGGMSDNVRPALYGADYTATLASREPLDENVRSRVVGKHCESGDIVVKDVALTASL